ncbi:Mu transposase C-terminal domain-containing protein, partial [Falsigemmobacter faecalis]
TGSSRGRRKVQWQVNLPPERQEAIERGRRWIYVAIDCATRCILSLRLVEAPNSEDATRALHDIFRDKTDVAKAAGCESTWHQHGGIGALVTDQGTAFTSGQFKGAVESLGGTRHLPPAGLPWLRGTIESLFKTFGHKLMPLLVGRTFFSSQERGDYPSEQPACLCDEDLIRVLLTFVVDIYHNEPHGSLKGATPNEAWKRLTAEYGVPPVPDGLTLCKAFGRPLQRKLRGDGVMFSGLTYSCDALREAFLHSPKREVEIRVDLQNMSWIAVKVGASWYPAIANQSGFENVTYAELTEATRFLRLRHGKTAELNAETIQRAISKIEEINRNALRLRGLTPFHVNDAEVERNQAALHFPIRADAERLSLTPKTKDPLKDGIFITRKLSSPTPQPESRPATPKDVSRTPRWRGKDDE